MERLIAILVPKRFTKAAGVDFIEECSPVSRLIYFVLGANGIRRQRFFPKRTPERGILHSKPFRLYFEWKRRFCELSTQSSLWITLSVERMT